MTKYISLFLLICSLSLGSLFAQKATKGSFKTTVGRGSSQYYCIQQDGTLGITSVSPLSSSTSSCVVPTPVPTQYTLTTTKIGTGTGTIAVSPTGTKFNAGTSITITATAASGSTFDGWTGACSGTGSVCSININSNLTATASFTLSVTPPPPPTQFTVTTNTVGLGTGTLTLLPAGGPTYNQGTTIVVTETPTNNSIFDGWFGACSGTGSCAVTLNSDVTITASFSPMIVLPPPTGNALFYFCDLAIPDTTSLDTNAEICSAPAGAPLTIYGSNLGTGAVPYLWYQKVTVPAPSVSGFITVNGTLIPFKSRAGTINHVTSAAQLKAIRSTWKAGDVYYLDGTWALTGDDNNGWNATFSYMGPSGQNYAEGTAALPISLVESVGSNVTIGPGQKFGIRGDRSYLTMAGFNLRSDSIGGNPQWSTGVRYIALDISSPNHGTQSGCISFNFVNNIKFLGNDVHNCGTAASDKQDHSVYFSTDVNHVIEAYNNIHDNQTCYGTQFHSSPITTGSGNNQFDLFVHDNRIFNQYCSGINFATIDPHQGRVRLENNLIYNVGNSAATDGGVRGCVYVPGYTNAGSAGSGNVEITNNTFDGCGPDGFITDNDSSHPVVLKNNIIKTPKYFSINATQTAKVSSSGNNIWFGGGAAPFGNLSADPQLDTKTEQPNPTGPACTTTNNVTTCLGSTVTK